MTNKIPMIGIQPHGITLYDQYLTHRQSKPDQGPDEATPFPKPYRWHPPRNNTPDGVLSRKAARRIETAIKWLLFFSKTRKAYNRETGRYVRFRLCIATITLSSPQHHSDQVIKSKLFNQLLTELREQCGMLHYIWRAEKQQNGNIHFHLVTNIFLSAVKLRQRWNRIQDKLGYVQSYSQRMNTDVKTFNDYRELYFNQGKDTMTLHHSYARGKAVNWTNPNSTDIHGISKEKNIFRYIASYMSKNLLREYGTYDDIPENLLVSGKLWGLSQTLSALKQVNTAVDSFISEDLDKIWAEYTDQIVTMDYCTFIPISFSDIILLGCSAILRFIFEKLKEIGVYTLSLT